MFIDSSLDLDAIQILVDAFVLLAFGAVLSASAALVMSACASEVE